MTDNIHQLEPHTKMTVDEAFSVARREEMQDVIIIGYDKEGDFMLYSSQLKTAEGLFLIKVAEKRLMDTI
jgi:hypothetical protein